MTTNACIGRVTEGTVAGVRQLLGIVIVSLCAIVPLPAQVGVADGFTSVMTRLIDSLPNNQIAADLRRLYLLSDRRALWTDQGRPTRQALDALAFIDSARQRGLRPVVYDSDVLHARLGTLQSGDMSAPADSTRLAELDVTLSRALLQLMADLDHGRIDPANVGFDIPNRRTRDLPTSVLAVSRGEDIAGVIATVEPPYAGYAALLRLLAQYRALAADSSLVLPPNEATIHPGDLYAGAPRLRRFLLALGDIPPRTAAPSEPNRYAGSLVLGVIHFQRRHGLPTDGVLNAATRAALRVPLSRRVLQIELALERWRWLPERAPSRYVVVNIPAFRLYAFEDDSAAERPLLSMNVIVGQAEDQHATPVFFGEMRELVFRPYWDIPPRIARTEIVPAVRRGSIDMESEGYEIVGLGEEPRTYAATGANLQRVSDGTLRIRQRPGNGNALGLVKFVFPNNNTVYLHGTPAMKLFAYARRDFSHGCIRVEQPSALARYALRGDSVWGDSAIDAAMHGTRTLHVPLTEPASVFILYMTAVVAPDGTAYFYRDLYGEDAKLERLLGAP